MAECSVSAPDELAAFLLQRQLSQLGDSEIWRVGEHAWQVRLKAAGVAQLAAALELTRQWMARERIETVAFTTDGQTHTLRRRDAAAQ